MKRPFQQVFFSLLAVVTVLADLKGYQSENTGGLIPVQLKRYGFNALLKHLNEAGLVPTLASEGGPFTVFAPTDEALEALNPDLVRAIEVKGWGRPLKRLIIRQAIPESSIRNGAVFKNTLRLGLEISLSVNDKQVASLNNGEAQIIGKIEAENGIIYPINRLDILDFSGVLKVIDNDDLNRIVLTTFEKAIEVAGLTAMIEDPDKLFTVFAPTDAAINELGSNVVKDFLSNPEKLRKILLDQYIVPGLYFTNKLSDNEYITSAGGQRLLISKNSGEVRVGAGKIISGDRYVSNGVIHVIDKVQPITTNVLDYNIYP